MLSSFLFCISITLLVFTLTIESVYHPFLYDDGNGGEEHCCLVQVYGKMCFATPVTRSLVQVNKQCGRFDRFQRRRFNGKNNNNEYIDKISRRLEVQRVEESEDKIFIELQKPLEQPIVNNDLICLTSVNNNINVEKCHVELADDELDELDEDDIPRRAHKRRRPRGHHSHIDPKKRSMTRTNQEEEEDIVDDDTEKEKNDAENEIRRIKLAHPIRIREGHSLSILRRYHINRDHIRPTNRQQRQCSSWYRHKTRQIHRNPSKHLKSCITLTDAREKCIYQLLHSTFNQTEVEQHKKLSFPFGSKLYCENQAGFNKLLGQYHRAEICFDRHDQIYIEHQFTDIADLSNMYKNKDTLEVITNYPKLFAEFEDDCHGKTNLVETTESEKLVDPKSEDE